MTAPSLTFAPTLGALDAVQRGLLMLDTLRRRGNQYLEHMEAGEPPLLKFAHEVVVDGHSLPRPCNYLLLQLAPSDQASTAVPTARPVVVVDPRAGHGPGIGGFKDDSEVGVALRAGHPVYFVAFRPEPVEGQTLADVMAAEAHFLEVVHQRHPACAQRPLVIGNCQAGWAMAMLAARRPALFGPLVLVGSPLSYWGGGASMNPMRYTGAVLGGAWLAALAADLGGGLFDGAHLVKNFEDLNPANTFWTKYRKLWNGVDTETERFLEFERWWGGFFRMTGAEFEFIVENLFVGNRLARGEVEVDGEKIDLRAITSPVVVFASWGDNITPPPQALNWIIDTWGDERAIATAGRVIVYVLHETVGHLGIFVGADIARKQHDQIVSSLDVIDKLPPGLYEMKLRHHDGSEPERWQSLEPGSYSVNFEHRTMDELRAVNPEGRAEEQLFDTVAQVSERQLAAYRQWVRPWLQQWPLRALADAALPWHPLRWQRHVFSDRNPAMAWVQAAAGWAKAHRCALEADHPARQWEQSLSDAVESSLDSGRRQRDDAVVRWARWAYGPAGLGAWLAPAHADEAQAQARAEQQLKAERPAALARLHEGGLPAAVCRIVLAGMKSDGRFERRSFRLARLLAALPGASRAGLPADVDWARLFRDEAGIAALAPVEALEALSVMLPDRESRETAMALAAAVLMIEPTINNPSSEVIDWLVGALDVDPGRVMDLAFEITKPVEQGASARPRAPRRTHRHTAAVEAA